MYVELKCKSNFSFLRGASHAEEYVRRAKDLGMTALGITDVNGVYALPRAFEVARQVPGFNLISGAEVTLSDHPSVTLLTQNRAGYGTLCELLTALHAGKDKGSGRLSFMEFTQFLSSVPKRREELIALPNLDDTTRLEPLYELFGPSMYLPLCRYLDGLDAARTALAKREAQRWGLMIVATNDPHYHARERRELQDCLTCIRESTDLRHAGFQLFGNAERYLKSPLQMEALFSDMPQAIRATAEIAERTRFRLSELSYTYPAELIPAGHSAQSHFETLVLRGAQRLYRGVISARVDEQIRHEFRLIEKLNYANYFLTIHDIVEFARAQNIYCQGRGSAANSICCYALGITPIDPVRMNLLFERFISENRLEPPDIDVDFEHQRREEVIQFIYERYGRSRAGMVSAVRTYRSRSAFLEISKAIGIPVGTRNARTLENEFVAIAGSDADKLGVIRKLVDEVEGFPRHLSIHSGGFTLSHEPIIRTVPIEPARMEGRTIVQWDKNDLDTVGLVKVDVLSLGFLTALHKCCDLLGITRAEIPPEDPATYAMIIRAETDGCFQIESRAQKSMLPRNQPRTFYDLVCQVAIVRPGPGEGQMVHPFLQRRQAELRGEPYRCPVPELQSVLGRTYGVPIFQEQVMKLAMVKGGFTPQEADQLRRSLGSWRSAESVGSMSEMLYARLLANGVPRDFADELFGYMKGFAHYGFPESHAASFAIIAYESAYLKCHHPAEFLCALINSQPMGFYPIDTLINEAKRNGVRVLPIHPNLSDWEAQMEGPNTVRMGFCNVRKIREQDVRGDLGVRELGETDYRTPISADSLHEHFRVLAHERAQKPFADFQDFCLRTKFSRDVLELMSMADVFGCFGLDQRHTFWKSVELKNLLNVEPAQTSLLLEGSAMTSIDRPASAQLFAPLSDYEAICAEYRAKGYSLRGNPMVTLRKDLPWLPRMNSRDVKQATKGSAVHFAGIMTVLQRPPTAKGTAFMTLEDDDGSVDVVIRKPIYEKYRQVIAENRFLIIRGRVQRQGYAVSVLMTEVEGFSVEHRLQKISGPGESGRGLGRFID